MRNSRKLLVASSLMLASAYTFAAPPSFIPPGHQYGGGTIGGATIEVTNRNTNFNRNKVEAVSNSNATAVARSNSSSSSLSGAYNGGNTSDVTVEGDEYDLPSNSVPMSIGGVCTDAAAAQNSSGGFSFSRANPVCEKLKMFEIYTKMGMHEEAAKSLKNAEALADVRGFFRGLLTVLSVGFF